QRDRRISPDSGSLFQTIPRRALHNGYTSLSKNLLPESAPRRKRDAATAHQRNNPSLVTELAEPSDKN
ncbi:hypothetical protein, partial [Stutzerimonas nitrititolerans]|uniref:hypothetical protein n=1 Tax=Stutzerimonas nitrititolerans TaxID=2482751 RepID=UPI00289C1432